MTVGDVAAAAAEGAHHGSRGNSGVILGQILRGFSQTLRGKEEITANDLAQALQQASEAAYDAVPSPVEGTILTVSREISTRRHLRRREHRRCAQDVGARRRGGRQGRAAARPTSCPCSRKPASSIRAARGSTSSSRACIAPSPASRSSRQPAEEDAESLSLKERRERKGHRALPSDPVGLRRPVPDRTAQQTGARHRRRHRRHG